MTNKAVIEAKIHNFVKNGRKEITTKNNLKNIQSDR